jgi:hypothetical protein
MRPDLLGVAKVLIELGANVNAYRPGTDTLLMLSLLLTLCYLNLSTEVPTPHITGK